MSTWIYEFKGRNASLASTQNFLWNDNNIYIMDNHRAALWCWLQHLNPGEKYSIFHIDAHYDTLDIEKQKIIVSPKELIDSSFEDYLDFSQQTDLGPVYVFRWDNYLSWFLRLFNEQVGDFFTSTHKIGTEPAEKIDFEEVEIYELPEKLEEYLEGYPCDGWLLNIDLDYFFSRIPDSHELLVSDTYIDCIFDSVKKALDAGLVKALTVCLSPECSGGWNQAEELCQRLVDKLGLDFSLPQ